jgi:hypothetical protein
MAGTADRDAGREIQKAIAVHVPNFRALAVGHHEGIIARIGRRIHQGIARQQLARLRSRQIGFDMHLFHICMISLACRGLKFARALIHEVKAFTISPMRSANACHP